MSTKQSEIEIADTSSPWESGRLGRDKQYAVTASKEHGDQIDEALGLQMISIRLDKELIGSFKLLGEKYQMAYQPLMREALKGFVDNEFKRMALETLKNKVIQSPLQRVAKSDC